MMRLFTESAVLMAATAVAAYLTFYYHPKAPAPCTVIEPPAKDEVTLAMIEERWNGKVQWVDARPEEKYNEEHIPGAMLINEYDFTNQLFMNFEKLQDLDVPLIIYCNAERCKASRKISEELKARLPTLAENIWVLKGGWPAWKKANP